MTALAVHEAEAITTAIAGHLDALAENYAAVLPLIREAIEKGVPEILGYRSVGEYVSDRFKGALTGLGIDVRREVVAELSGAGLSTRAIAPIVGVSNYTVHADQAGVRNQTPAGVDPVTGEDCPPPVVGLDGKRYTRKAPAPVETAAERAAREERDNDRQHCHVMGRSLLWLSQFEHPESRHRSINEIWPAGADGASPPQREMHDPNRIRSVADALTTYADELEASNAR